MTQEVCSLSYLDEVEGENVEAEEQPEWMGKLVRYLEGGELSPDPLDARKVRRQSTNYLVMERVLYKRGKTHSSLRCLTPSEATQMLRDVYARYYNSHIGGKALAHMVLRQGYYWRTLKNDAQELVKRYDCFQRMGKALEP